jgi:methionyl-tRNA formyltransferase
MNVIFFGSSQFAVSILEYLHKHLAQIKAIVTQPDRPKGRRLKFESTLVGQYAEKSLTQIPLFKPNKASDESFVLKLSAFSPDLIICAAYGQIIKKNLLDLPKLGWVNVHTSLLPKYRGANPIRRAILAGEKVTGITIMKMEPQLDAGPIYAQKIIEIPEDMDFGQLEEKMAIESGPLLIEVVQKLFRGEQEKIMQDHSLATYAQKISVEETRISWSQKASKNHNLIRALSPHPGAWSYFYKNGEKKRLKILQSYIVDLKGIPGEVIVQDKGQLIVACKDKALEILKVQVEGKKATDIKNFLQGIREAIIFSS